MHQADLRAQLQPYRELACAVILRAVLDAAGPCPGTRGRGHLQFKDSHQDCQPRRPCRSCSAKRFLLEGAPGWAFMAGLRPLAITEATSKGLNPDAHLGATEAA